MQLKKIFTVAISLLVLPGCATIIKGYYSEVELKNAPDSVRVFTAEGVEIPVTKTTVRARLYGGDQKWIDRPATFIRLRSKYDQTLVLSSNGQERKVQAFGKIGAGWLILGTVCGFVPAAVDALTGNWNSFESIDANFK